MSLRQVAFKKLEVVISDAYCYDRDSGGSAVWLGAGVEMLLYLSSY